MCSCTSVAHKHNLLNFDWLQSLFPQLSDSTESTSYTFTPALQDISLKRYIHTLIIKTLFVLEYVFEILYAVHLLVVIDIDPTIHANFLCLICSHGL